jgi:hypothetical protein
MTLNDSLAKAAMASVTLKSQWLQEQLTTLGLSVDEARAQGYAVTTTVFCETCHGTGVAVRTQPYRGTGLRLTLQLCPCLRFTKGNA